MEWISINDKEPGEFETVLVATDLFGDEFYHFFVAIYDSPENEWILHIHSQPKRAPYIRISKTVLKNDKWCQIEQPEES